MIANEPRLTAKQAGTVFAEFGVNRSEEWFIRQRKDPAGPPFYKIGGRFFYYASELRDWWRSQRSTAA